MLQDVFNRLNEEGFNPSFNDDKNELNIVIGLSNAEELDADEAADLIADSSDVEVVLEEFIENGYPITYFYDTYDRADGVTVETINVTLT